MNIFDNFNKDVVKEQLEQQKKEIKEQKKIEELINKNKEQEYQKDGKTVYIPSYDLFKENFMKQNEDATEEDYEFIFKKKKGLYYINFDKAANYNIPHGECIGMTLLERRKFTNKDIINYVKGTKSAQKIYADLPTTPIGAIPIADGKYVIVTRRRIGIFNILWPLIFIRILATQLFI